MRAKLTTRERQARRRVLVREAVRRHRARQRAAAPEKQDTSTSLALAAVRAANVAHEARREATLRNPAFHTWLRDADGKVGSWNHAAWRLGATG